MIGDNPRRRSGTLSHGWANRPNRATGKKRFVRDLVVGKAHTESRGAKHRCLGCGGMVFGACVACSIRGNASNRRAG